MPVRALTHLNREKMEGEGDGQPKPVLMQIMHYSGDLIFSFLLNPAALAVLLSGASLQGSDGRRSSSAPKIS